jgi:hypothetical protein
MAKKIDPHAREKNESTARQVNFILFESGRIGLWASQKMEVFMKDITPALLATLFILYSLIILLSVELHPDNMSSPFVDNQKISDVGLQFAFKR